MENQATTETSAPTETTKARVAGAYVVIAHNAAGELIWAEKHSSKELKDSVNTLIASGGTIDAVYKGARKLEAKVKQVVTF
jgi:soluble P-type ATPase